MAIPESIPIRKTSGDSGVVDAARFDALRQSFAGRLLAPAADGYDEARHIWNGMIDRRPGIIAQCATTADVQAAVDFAREDDLLVSVRSVGHNIAGTALCDGGLVIDLSQMEAIDLDIDGKRARVQPGADWGALDAAAQPHGLAVPGGIVSTTGVAGLTVGGGFGWLTRKYGLTCDCLVSAKVVTADGVLRTASKEENAELFWALRGGGGNFGIVTEFEFEMAPLGPEVMAGLVLYPVSEAPDVMRFYREYAARAPRELGSLAVFRTAPEAPFIAPEHHGKPVVGIAVCYAGPVDEGARVVAPVKEFGVPIADVIAPKPFVAHQSMFDAGQPSGRRYYWKSEYLPGLDDGLIDVAAYRGAQFSSPLSSVLIMQLGGAARDRGVSDNAAPNRDAEFVYNIGSSWVDPAEDERHVAWTRSYWREIRPFSTGGTYMNFLTEDEGDDRIRAAYGDQYERLTRIKQRYDPTNLFRVNKNIRPSGA